MTDNILQVREAADQTGSASTRLLASANRLSHDARLLSVEITAFLSTVRTG